MSQGNGQEKKILTANDYILQLYILLHLNSI